MRIGSMSLPRVLVCLTAVAIVSAGCSRGDVEKIKRDYVARGDQYVKDKNADAAIIEYRNAIQRDPRFLEAYQKLTSAYTTKGDFGNALRTAITAADLAP